MITLNKKSIPQSIIDAVKAAAPASARKQKWTVIIRKTVTIRVTYWDGGSKKEYSAANVHGQAVQLPSAQRPGGHFSNPSTWIEPVYTVPNGVIVVEHGTFCGKTSSPFITMTKTTAEQHGLNL